MQESTQTPTIFTRIIRGEIPCHKIYEDDKTFAFLDHAPTVPGHTLVVPKIEGGKLYELPTDDYNALMATVKKVMNRQVEVFGPQYRSCIKVMGFDVPDHTHIQLIPCQTPEDYLRFEPVPELASEEALAEIAKKLAF